MQRHEPECARVRRPRAAGAHLLQLLLGRARVLLQRHVVLSAASAGAGAARPEPAGGRAPAREAGHVAARARRPLARGRGRGHGAAHVSFAAASVFGCVRAQCGVSAGEQSGGGSWWTWMGNFGLGFLFESPKVWVSFLKAQRFSFLKSQRFGFPF